jgi:NDP-sugar pyrophosphorylase family protein
VLEPQVLDYIESDATIWEKGPLEQLAADGQLAAYRHTGFWQPMDTLRDRNVLGGDVGNWQSQMEKCGGNPNDSLQSLLLFTKILHE